MYLELSRHLIPKMLLKRLILENFKCYKYQEFSFQEGITSISGENGVGKSSILEAVSWILFNSRNYSSTQKFLKAGNKSGRVRLYIESSRDGKLYLLDRSLPSGAAAVKSEMTGGTVCEGVTEMQNWVKYQLGLHQEDNLEALCRNGIAPPQGSLTRDFLDSPARRKQIFDNLLGLDNYKLLDEKLRDTQSYLGDQLKELGFRMVGYQEIKSELEQLKADLTEINLRISEVETECKSLALKMKEAREEYEREQDRLTALKCSEALIDETKTRLMEIEADLIMLKEARTSYEQSKPLADQYEILKSNRKAKQIAYQERQVLLANQSEIIVLIERYKTELANIETQLQDLSEQKIRYQTIKPQIELYQKAAQKLETLFRERVQLENMIANKFTLSKEQEEIDASILNLRQIEKELPIYQLKASNLQSLQDDYLVKRSEYQEVDRLINDIKAIQITLPMTWRQIEREQMQVSLREIGDKIEKTEKLTQEHLAQESALLAQIKVNQELLPRLLEGGFCPLLQQKCKNLQDKPSDQSLTIWLEEQIKSLRMQADEFGQLGQIAQKEYNDLKEIQKNLLKIYELYAKIGDRTLDNIKQSGLELKTDLEEAQLAINFCERYRDLSDELDRLQKNQADISQKLIETDQAEKRYEKVIKELVQVETDKTELQSVAEEGLILSDKLNKLDYFMQLKEQSARRHSHALDENQKIELKLQEYDSVPDQLKQIEMKLEEIEPIYQNFLLTKAELSREESQTTKYKELKAAIAKYKEDIDRLTEQSLPSDDWYGSKLQEIEALQKAQNEKEAEMIAQKHIYADRAKRRDEVAGKQREFQALEDKSKSLAAKLDRLNSMRGYFRLLATKMAERLTQVIGEKATLIMREIMQDGSYELKWTEDYEIIAYRFGQELSFEMLSGGQQSAAAIAIRLGILEGLSHVRFAFLDEPTAHLDQERCHQLALQLGSIQSFEQLFVITHDESFASQVQNRITLPL
ncbi:MAG: SMC family ATPase [Candidatus Caenarcaniphilales bacterium]|nr:SMC family ATPase [Candidatus Caenarcaniphilales bacterium]